MKVVQPWKLRLEHFGFSHIQMEWEKGSIHFNPTHSIEDGDIAVVLWNWPEQLKGVKESVQQGKKCRVIAPQQILDWLAQFGEVNGGDSCSVAGLDIEIESYQPIPPLTLREGLRKVKATARNPFRSIERLREKDLMPSCAPHIAWIRFPSGVLFGHLHLSLHSKTPADWWSRIQPKAKNATWLLVGCDYHMDEDLLQYLSSFSDQQILLTDLIGDYRRKMGMPTQLLTPIADQAIIKNLDVQVFATKVGYRFDTVNLVP